MSSVRAYFVDVSKVRSRASAKVQAAIRAGKLPRLKTADIQCVRCRKAKAVHYEHRRYAEPLAVVPVCCQCNTDLGPAEDAVIRHRYTGETITVEQYRMGGLRGELIYMGPSSRTESEIRDSYRRRLRRQAARMLGLKCFYGAPEQEAELTALLQTLAAERGTTARKVLNQAVRDYDSAKAEQRRADRERRNQYRLASGKTRAATLTDLINRA